MILDKIFQGFINPKAKAPWYDDPVKLAKHHRHRKIKNAMAKASRRRNRK